MSTGLLSHYQSKVWEKKKEAGLRQNRFPQHRRKKKIVCLLQFISSCRLGTSTLPTCYPLERLLSLLWCLQTDSLTPLHSSPSTFLKVQLVIKFTENAFLPFRTFISFSSVQSLSCVRLFVTPWTAARQASLSITNSQSLLKLMSVESVMPSNHLILYCPLLLPPSVFLSIRVFSNESDLRIRWPKYWSFSFSISPSNEYSGLISFRMDW